MCKSVNGKFLAGGCSFLLLMPQKKQKQRKMRPYLGTIYHLEGTIWLRCSVLDTNCTDYSVVSPYQRKADLHGYVFKL